MNAPLREHNAEEHHFHDELSSIQAQRTLQMVDLYPVKLSLSAELGKCPMLVRDVLDLRPGSVLILDKQAGEMAELHLNGIPFAKGEIVVLGDSLHVRIAEVPSTLFEEDSLGG